MNRWAKGREFHRDAGFTLMELVVAMVIIGIVIVALTGIQISAAVTIAQARDRQEATALANEAMEQMRAIPFAILGKGLDHDFLTAAGADPNIVAGKLKVDGVTEDLVVATASQDQNTAVPWAPLFSTSGSNKQVRTNSSGTGVPFTIRAYTTKGVAGGTTTVGMVVVVSWPDRRGGDVHTTLRSVAYSGGAGGCGSLETSPFLGACQALLGATASSGNIVTTVSGSDLTPDANPVPLLGPGAGTFYTLSVRTASAEAGIDSQQVTVAGSYINYGGTTADDNDTATQSVLEGWTEGFSKYERVASDNEASSGIPEIPSTLSWVPASTDETQQSVADAATSAVTFAARSDYLRPSTLDSHFSSSGCVTGMPGSTPCGKAVVKNEGSYEGGSGYITMTVNGTTFRLSRRIVDLGGGANYDDAWVGRYLASPGTVASVGCTSLTNEGCIAAGAQRQMATINMGKVYSGSGKWGTGHDKAAEGIVVIEGKAGCTSGLFSQSVLVQRGDSQKSTASTINRCGQIRYWGAGGYVTVPITNAEITTFASDPVTWTDGTYTVEAFSIISVAAVNDVKEPAVASDCKLVPCLVTADAGNISVSTQYIITWPTGGYTVTANTVINAPTASASFKKAPNA